jgi:hypothetical protein
LTFSRLTRRRAVHACRVGRAPWAAVVLLVLLCAGCGDIPVSNTGVDCTAYGGCDVLEDLSDGSSTIVALRSMSFFPAQERAITDVQKANVVDTVVVGHDPPHTPLGKLYHH